MKAKKFAINLFASVILGAICLFGITNAAAYAIPQQVTDVLDTVVSWLTIIAGTLALVFIILGGINFMTAAGDQAKIKTARDMVTWAFVGIIIVAIAQVFKNIANSIGTQMGGNGI